MTFRGECVCFCKFLSPAAVRDVHVRVWQSCDVVTKARCHVGETAIARGHRLVARVTGYPANTQARCSLSGERGQRPVDHKNPSVDPCSPRLSPRRKEIKTIEECQGHACDVTSLSHQSRGALAGSRSWLHLSALSASGTLTD